MRKLKENFDVLDAEAEATPGFTTHEVQSEL